ncbi:MAG: transglutaminase TgpA family protein, partial [Actinomycetota bacterium]
LPVGLPNIGRGLLSWQSGKGDGGGGGGAGASGRVDLLVSIAPQLIEQSGRKMFEVEADKATYWRLASLAEFDGESWGPPEGSQLWPLGPSRITHFDRPGDSRKITQTFTLDGLEGEHLPAAAVAHEVDILTEGARTDEDVLYDNETGELELEHGVLGDIRYRVRSYVPDVTYEQLRDADVGEVDDPDYTEAPELSNEVRELLAGWVRGAGGAAEQLIAIQDALRSFEYSTDVQTKASTDYLTQFLTKTEKGYCQQFATAFAVLARTLGHPARVSVGFLPGQQPYEGVQGFSYAQAQPILPEGGSFTVRGDDAHAWPEVYFEDYGWVPFEPTPRAGVGAPSYTFPTTTGGGAPLPGSGPGGALAPNPDEFAGQEGAEAARPDEILAGEQGGSRGDPLWERAFDRLATGLLAVLLAFLIAVPVVKEGRIRMRYRRAGAPSQLALASFFHFQMEAAELASPRLPAESASGFAARLASVARAPRQSALTLAGLYEAAEYSPGELSEEEGARTRRLAAQLRRALWRSASWWDRAARLFSPRSLLR